MTHEGMVLLAHRHFPAPKSVETDTFEKARDRLFGLLREANKYLDPVARWRSACRVTHRLIEGRSEPQRSWAVRILDEDLAKMLAALHSSDLAHEYSSAWPDRWGTPDEQLSSGEL